MRLPTHHYWAPPSPSRFTCVLAPLRVGHAKIIAAKIGAEEQTFKAEMCDGTRAFTQAFSKLGVRLSMLHNDELATP